MGRGSNKHTLKMRRRKALKKKKEKLKAKIKGSKAAPAATARKAAPKRS